MAEFKSPVSDTQALLQSMLQKLKLQPHSDTNAQEPTPFSLTEGDVRTAENSSDPRVYQFGASLETEQQGRTTSIYTTDSPWTSQLSSLKSATPTPPKEPAGEVKVHNLGVSTWGFSNSCTVSEGNSDVISSSDVANTPRRVKKQLKFLRRRTSEDNSVSSFPTTDDRIPPHDLSLLAPALAAPGHKVSEGQDQGGVWAVGDERGSNTRTSRNKKRADAGQKKWTQKVKERWRERKRNPESRVNRDTEQHHEVAEVCCPPTFTRTNENTTATAFSVEAGLQQHPINSGPDEAPPSPLDHMSEPIFSFGSFNLMEEIFSGQEWAKFFPASTNSQSESSCTAQDKTTNSISQLYQEKQTVIRQWDYKDTTESNLSMAPSQMNSGGLQQDMDTSEHFYTQTNASDFSMPLLPKGHLELADPSGSNQRTRSMDPYLIFSQNTERTKDRSPSLDHNLNSQLQTHVAVHQMLSDDHSLNHSQDSELVHGQSESKEGLSDISYLQPRDGSSLMAHGSLNRKRGHGALSRNPNEQVGLQFREVDEWREDPLTPRPDDQREDLIMPLYSPHPAPTLSSVHPLQCFISQDSEYMNTETVVKKRRVDNPRRVRFAEEVVILPPLIVSEDENDDENDEDEDDNDEDDDDEDDDDEDDDDEDDDEGDKSDEECREEPLSRPTISGWIVALRSKAKKKAKLIARPHTRPRSSKKSLFY
ncbi:uncharacterized protein LOC143527281 [Brachyhypopomus gauderio]|uniref:uncharacterized protein LOC143527281 n=1 Tax=Brachyhypopomus gauderio TaxID=698409 RepID=UPI00404122A9